MKISTVIDFIVSYILSLFFLAMFMFSIWFLFFSKYTFSNQPLILFFLVLQLFFGSSMQLVSHYIYLKKYDIEAKYYLSLYFKSRANPKLYASNRPIPFTRSNGKYYVRFTYHQFFSKDYLETIKGASLGLKSTMILFNSLLVLQLITFFIVLVLIVDLLLFEGVLN